MQLYLLIEPTSKSFVNVYLCCCNKPFSPMEASSDSSKYKLRSACSLINKFSSGYHTQVRQHPLVFSKESQAAEITGL